MGSANHSQLSEKAVSGSEAPSERQAWIINSKASRHLQAANHRGAGHTRAPSLLLQRSWGRPQWVGEAACPRCHPSLLCTRCAVTCLGMQAATPSCPAPLPHPRLSLTIYVKRKRPCGLKICLGRGQAAQMSCPSLPCSFRAVVSNF